MLAILLPSVSLPAADTILPEKTLITLQLNNPLSTRVNSEGDAFTAVVTSPVSVADRIVIPKGSEVTGSVSRILRPGRFKGKAVMNLLFQSISIPGRGQLPIAASLVGVNSEGSEKVRSEGTVEAGSSGTSDAGRVVIPGLAGAGVGALAGGGKGAAIGAGVGSAVGLAAVFATRGNEIEIRRGSTLDISLDQPLVISPRDEDLSDKNR
jgi:hypothetical protein